MLEIAVCDDDEDDLGYTVNILQNIQNTNIKFPDIV